MLPPIQDQILQSNPKFATLYTSLSKKLLNPSGSTKQHPAQKEREALSETLTNSRKQAAKTSLILTSLINLDLGPVPSARPIPKQDSKTREQIQYKPLPTELTEIIILLSSRLTPTSALSSPAVKLLESTEQWNTLPVHIPQIASMISTHLQKQALALARISNPSTNASFLHRGIPKLVSSVRSLQQSNSSMNSTLETRRMELVGKTTTLLAIYHLTISLIIGILEQSKHGSVARHIKSKAEHLAVAARTLEYESKEKGARGNRMLYTDEVNEALGNYMRHLRDSMERMRERKRDAERVLWGYGVGREQGEKEKVMREIARVYGELGRDLSEVAKDVERLKGK